MINSSALVRSSLAGTVLQVCMVVAGHTRPSIAALYAVGGMGLSLLAGLAYAAWAREPRTSLRTAGGLLAGAICAFIGILVSRVLGDVPTSLLLLGTVSSAVTGALGGAAGGVVFRSIPVAAGN